MDDLDTNAVPPTQDSPPDIAEIKDKISQLATELSRLSRVIQSEIKPEISRIPAASANANKVLFEQISDNQINVISRSFSAMNDYINQINEGITALQRLPERFEVLGEKLEKVSGTLGEELKAGIKEITSTKSDSGSESKRREQELRLWFKNLFYSFSQQKFLGFSLNWIQALWYQTVLGILLSLAMVTLSLGVYWEVRGLAMRIRQGVVCEPRPGSR